MNCGTARIQISALLDDSLSAPERAGLERHLDACRACTAFLEEQRQLSDWLQEALPELDPPAGVWVRVASRLNVPPPSPFSFEGLLRGLATGGPAPRAAAALALLLALSAGLLYWGRTSPERMLLAELEEFDLTVEGNPFMPAPGAENPFLDLQEGAGNPFRKGERAP